MAVAVREVEADTVAVIDDEVSAEKVADCVTDDDCERIDVVDTVDVAEPQSRGDGLEVRDPESDAEVDIEEKILGDAGCDGDVDDEGIRLPDVFAERLLLALIVLRTVELCVGDSLLCTDNVRQEVLEESGDLLTDDDPDVDTLEQGDGVGDNDARFVADSDAEPECVSDLVPHRDTEFMPDSVGLEDEEAGMVGLGLLLVE